MELHNALLSSFATPITDSENFRYNPADFVGQTILFKAANGTTRLWRAAEVTIDTSAGLNIGWQLIYGLRFASGLPTSSDPYGVGEWYVDTSNNVVYLAKGRYSDSWITLVGGGGGGGE
jgi:hypothetical protein